jgi:hypothetical protein
VGYRNSIYHSGISEETGNGLATHHDSVNPYTIFVFRLAIAEARNEELRGQIIRAREAIVKSGQPIIPVTIYPSTAQFKSKIPYRGRYHKDNAPVTDTHIKDDAGELQRAVSATIHEPISSVHQRMLAGIIKRWNHKGSFGTFTQQVLGFFGNTVPHHVLAQRIAQSAEEWEGIRPMAHNRAFFEMMNVGSNHMRTNIDHGYVSALASGIASLPITLDAEQANSRTLPFTFGATMHYLDASGIEPLPIDNDLQERAVGA